MKKVLTVLALIAFTGSVFAATSFTTKLNNGLNTLNKKEQALNNKIDKAQAQRAAQKAEAQKKADAEKKAIEAKKAAAQKQAEANKKAIEAQKAQAKQAKADVKKAVNEEKSFWKSLFSTK